MATGRIPHRPGGHTATLAMSADGRTRFSAVTAADHQDLVEQHDGSAETVTVSRTPQGAAGGAGFGSAVFDGRWLVYEVDLSPDNNAAWKIFAWDSRGGGAPLRRG